MNLGIELAHGTGAPQQPLWLPPGLRKNGHHEKWGLIVPDRLKLLKAVYFKGRLFVRDPSRAPANLDYRWRWNWLRCPYNLDIDEPGEDGISVRDQIHLWITGKLERVSGGYWAYQNGDERWSTTLIEEWPLSAHSPERFVRFQRREV